MSTNKSPVTLKLRYFPEVEVLADHLWDADGVVNGELLSLLANIVTSEFAEELVADLTTLIELRDEVHMPRDATAQIVFAELAAFQQDNSRDDEAAADPPGGDHGGVHPAASGVASYSLEARVALLVMGRPGASRAECDEQWPQLGRTHMCEESAPRPVAIRVLGDSGKDCRVKDLIAASLPPDDRGVSEADGISQTDRRSLRQILQRDPSCTHKFGQAEILSRSLFDPDRPPQPKAVIPFFTDHSASHFERIEAYANEMLFGLPLGRFEPDRAVTGNEAHALDEREAFVPSPEEAMYLLAAIWLHDIGMIVGPMPNDTLGNDTDWNAIRDTHEMRASEYIHKHWQINCSWSDQEREYLAELCIHHRQRHPLRDMDLASVPGTGGRTIRLRKLAAILRLADACHSDVTRTHASLLNPFRVVDLPVDSMTRWGRPQLVNRVQFDQRDREIRLFAQVPRPRIYGTVTVDFKWLIHRIAGEVAAELASVEPFLVRYSNTAFHRVEPVITRPVYQSEPAQRMCELWPDLMASVHSASEAACMVAALVDAMVGTARGGKIPVWAIEQLLDHTVKMHRFNILVRRLRKEVGERVHGDPRVLRRYIAEYLEDRVVACAHAAESAHEKINVRPDDWLVVYGYSHCVMSLFAKHLRAHRGRVLIVECRLPRAGVPLLDEAKRVYDDLSQLGLDCNYVRLESLPLIFQRCAAGKPRQRVVVLLGAQGILNGGEALCLVGNASIALAAHHSGADVYVLSEVEKHSREESVDQIMAADLTKVATNLTTDKQRNLPEDRPEIDVLSPELFTAVFDIPWAARQGKSMSEGLNRRV